MAVPSVVGDTQTAATTAITGAGLTVGTVTMQSSNTAASGNVISESPVAGMKVASGSAVNLVISTGPAPVNVPNVVGDTQLAATTAIAGAGLTVGTVTMQSSNTAASGNVISESPVAGMTVASGSAVNLVIAAMPPGLWVSGTLALASQPVDNNFIGLMDADGFFVFANWNSSTGDYFYVDTCSYYGGMVSVSPSGALVGNSTRWDNSPWAANRPGVCAGQYNNPIGLSGSINLSTGVLALTETEGPISGMPSGVSETFTAPISSLFTVPPASLTVLQGLWLSAFATPAGAANVVVCLQYVLGYAEPCQFVIDASGNVTSADVNGTGTGTISIPNAADNIIDLHLSYPNGVTARGIWFYDTVVLPYGRALVGWAVTYDSSGNAINMFQTTVFCDGC